MKRLRLLSSCALAAAGLVTSASGQVQVAGTLQVNVDATTALVGPITYLTNSGALGGVFLANNNGVAGVTPQVIALGGSGTRGVLLDGNAVSLRHFTDESGSTAALPPSTMVGSAPVFSVEAWMYKATINNGTGPVAWGTRADGRNVSCNWGRNIDYGGLSWQGGNWDHGWNVVPSAGSWHHLVWTYDGAGIVKLYRDGVLDARCIQTAALDIAGEYNILIGAQHEGTSVNNHAAGVVGKVRIHDGVLTDSQVAANYAAEAPAFTNSAPAQDLVTPPLHRYSFSLPASSDVTGATVPDTGSANGTPKQADAVIKGNAGTVTSDGTQITIINGSSATQGYVDLPNGLLSSLSANNGGPGKVTFEMWVRVYTTANWSELLYFGNSSAGEITGPGGSFNGANGVVIPCQISDNSEQTGFRGVAGDRAVGARLIGSRKHIVVTWDESNDKIRIYHEGVLVGDFAAGAKMSAVSDVNNWLGRSGWAGDANAPAIYREFRIYDRVLADNEVRRNYLVGPDVVDATTLAWNGNVNGDWNTTTANWLADAVSSSFADGKNVQFDDNAAGTTSVNLAGTLAPASVMVGNDSKAYTFSGTGKITGATGLTKQGVGTLTITAQGNDYTGPSVLTGGKTVVSKLADGGAASSLGASSADPRNLRIGAATLSYAGPAASMNRGLTMEGLNSTLDVQNSLSISGNILAARNTSFIKDGPGVLTIRTVGSNYLASADPGLQVARGTMVFDGTGGGQTNNTSGETWVGGTALYPAHMIISNSTLVSASWFGIGRGNGDIGNISTVTLNDGRLTISANGLAMGYSAGRPNLSTQRLTLNGASGVYIPGNVNIGEHTGASATVALSGTSWLRGSTIRLGISTGSTGAVVLANSSVITNANYTSIGTATGSGPGDGGMGSMIVRDNAAFYSTSDFNVSDNAFTEGTLDLLNNGTITSGSFFVGKGNGSIGVMNQSGGLVEVGQWLSIGRYSGSTGNLNISGGSLVLTNATTDATVGEEGNGTLTVSGTATVSIKRSLRVGLTGGYGLVDLNGGTIIAKQVVGSATGSSYFNFNGGKLVAAEGANPDFMTGLSQVQIMAGGATIDTGTNDLVITQAIYDAGGTGFTKLGSGSLKIVGDIFYAGPVTVSAGKLEFGTSVQAKGSYNIAAGARFGVRATESGLPINATALTLGADSSLDFDLGNFGNPASALFVTDAATRNGNVSVNIAPQSTLAVGTVPLVQWTTLGGSGNFVLGTLPPGVGATLETRADGLYLVVSSVSLPRWEGLAGGTWDIGLTTNWIDQVTGLPLAFEQGYSTVFDDKATGTTNVDLVDVVSPGGVLVSNSVLNYTIAGKGRITGGGTLTKVGTGSLTLATTNNAYSGGTVIDEGGTLISTVPNNVGPNAPLTIGAGTLNLGTNNQKFSIVTVTNGTIAGTATVTAEQYALSAGEVSTVLAGGILSTFGTNAEDIINVTGMNTYTGRTVLAGSTLAVSKMANAGSPSGLGVASANPTNLVFNGGALSYTGPAAATDRGYQVAGNGTFSVANALTLQGEVLATAGTFNKAGAGTLTYARPGTNVLSTGGFHVAQGTVVFDGAAGAQTNRVNEMFLGYNQVDPANVILNNSSLNIGNWLAIDRGNGTTGLSSSMTLNNSYVMVNNLSMGYANNVSGLSTKPRLTLAGNSSFVSANQVLLGESLGSEATIIMKDNSQFILNNGWFALGNSGQATLIMSNSAAVTLPGDNNLGDVGDGVGKLYMYDTTTNRSATLYVGKGERSVGEVYQYGGYLGHTSGGGDWRLANNSTATGTYNLYGGVFEPVNNFQMGASGVGVFNQFGGIANCAGYPSVGRYTGSTGTMNVSGGVFTQNQSGNLLLIGEAGTGTLNVSGTGVVNVLGGLSVGQESTGNGTVNLDGGRLAVGRIQSPGSASGGSGTFNFNGGVLAANGNHANFMTGLTAASVQAGGAIIDSANYTITIAQPLLAGTTSGGLVKLGTGSLILGGANTYTGGTIVSNGALFVNGTLPGTVAVRSGAAVAGTGTIAGVVTVQAGGILSAGASIGTMTLGATPSLGGTVLAEVDRNNGTPLADRIVVTGSPLVYGGTLAITNTGAALQVGDTFTLFNASGYSGTFTLVSMTPGQEVVWNTSNLAQNGTITVSSVSSKPVTGTNIVAVVTGGKIDISWPSDYTGWALQAQTNGLSVGLGNNWTEVPNSTTTNRVILDVDKTKGAVFFRMVSPLGN
jgi:autotransporter-associated beta strand protein/T5SS/PEP-CTERM-associated repeat protein